MKPKRKTKKDKVREAIKQKLKFWNERTGDTNIAKHISVREIVSDGFLLGKKTHYGGSDQLILTRKGKDIYDSNRTHFKTEKDAVKFVMDNINLKEIK